METHRQLEKQKKKKRVLFCNSVGIYQVKVQHSSIGKLKSIKVKDVSSDDDNKKKK